MMYFWNRLNIVVHYIKITANGSSNIIVEFTVYSFIDVYEIYPVAVLNYSVTYAYDHENGNIKDFIIARSKPFITSKSSH